MKLILENWRKYITEDDEDYDEFEHEDSWEDGGPPRTPVQRIITMVVHGGQPSSLQARELVLILDFDIEEIIEKLTDRYAKVYQEYEDARKQVWQYKPSHYVKAGGKTKMTDAARDAYVAAMGDKEVRKTREIKESIEDGIKSFIAGHGMTEEQSEAIKQELYAFSPSVLDILDLRRAETNRSRRNLIAYWHKSLEQGGADETPI